MALNPSWLLVNKQRIYEDSTEICWFEIEKIGFLKCRGGKRMEGRISRQARFHQECLQTKNRESMKDRNGYAAS
jgi:hypothetical protein